MNYDLKTLLRIAGFVCNAASAALAAAALYMNREATISITTSAWGANDLFRDIVLSQSRFIIASVIFIALGTMLQAASELAKRHRHEGHHNHAHVEGDALEEHAGKHHRHNHNHH